MCSKFSWTLSALWCNLRKLSVFFFAEPKTFKKLYIIFFLGQYFLILTSFLTFIGPFSLIFDLLQAPFVHAGPMNFAYSGYLALVFLKVYFLAYLNRKTLTRLDQWFSTGGPMSSFWWAAKLSSFCLNA